MAAMMFVDLSSLIVWALLNHSADRHTLIVKGLNLNGCLSFGLDACDPFKHVM